MKKEVYLTILYDYYGDLFNEKQKNYFECYFFSDLSLGEVSESLKVSRNAVFKQLKNIEKKLLFYEEKLHMYEKDKKLEMILLNMNNDSNTDKIKKIFLNK